MRFAKITAGGKTTWGLVEGDRVTEISGEPFGEWQKTSSKHDLKNVKIELPLVPRTFYCAGLNYAKHVKEAANRRGEIPNIPDRAEIGYRAQSALIAHDEDVVIPADATVRMAGPWTGERTASGTGDGPIAAAFAAISEILERPVEVTNLSLRSVTPGRDSVGQVFLQCRIGGKSLSGQGASTDIVEASARALVHALNKERYAERLEAEAHDAVQLWGV